MQAVILAAGMGTRIHDIHTLPKGFISFSDRSIIQESILKIKQCGINNILIVTGYSANYFETLAREDACIRTIFNPKYAVYSNLYSWYCAKDFIQDDFLLFESDIIYEKKAITQLLSDAHRNAILLSGTTHSGDEVFVEVNEKNNLVNLRKQKNLLKQSAILGEFVGISKINLQDYQQLMTLLETDLEQLHKGYYDEQGFVSMLLFTDLFCLKDSTLVWAEIDDKKQFELAKKLYEKIDV